MKGNNFWVLNVKKRSSNVVVVLVLRKGELEGVSIEYLSLEEANFLLILDSNREKGVKRGGVRFDEEGGDTCLDLRFKYGRVKNSNLEATERISMQPCGKKLTLRVKDIFQSDNVVIDVSSSSECSENDVNTPDPQKHFALYNDHPSSVSYGGEIEEAMIQDPISHERVLPSVGAFTVQCANCFKWRLVPSQEKYQEIREHIIENPFVCGNAHEWGPDVSCDDPADIEQDGSKIWAIDKPNIAQPPPGWQRLLRIRGAGCSKFSDVYYTTPTGKQLRSIPDVEKFLYKHPEYLQQGVTTAHFSFQTPKPLQEDYVKKRPSRVPVKLVGEGQKRDLCVRYAFEPVYPPVKKLRSAPAKRRIHNFDLKFRHHDLLG